MDWSLTSPRILTNNSFVRCGGMALVLVGAAVWPTDARAQVLAMQWEHSGVSSITQRATPDVAPDEDSAAPTEIATDIPARLRRQQLNYSTIESPGTIVIDTPNTYLYLLASGATALPGRA